MRIFARVVDGLVLELFPPIPTPPELLEILPEDGDIREMFAYPPEIWVEITGMDPKPREQWTYIDEVFAAPALPTLGPAERLIENAASRDFYLRMATLAMGPLQDAVDLEEATDEEVALLNKWKKFRVATNRVDLSLVSPAWPVAPA